MTVQYNCLGRDCPAPFLKWGHSACNKQWFKTPRFAVESASALSWNLGTCQAKIANPSKHRPSVCGIHRKVSFSDAIDVKLFTPAKHVLEFFCVPEAQLHDWINKPWHWLKQHCHDVQKFCFDSVYARKLLSPARTEEKLPVRELLRSIENLPDSLPENTRGLSMEPLCAKAVLIRNSPHFPIPSNTFRTTDAYYDVPSSWQESDEGELTEQPDDDFPNMFLHEAPDSVHLSAIAF